MPLVIRFTGYNCKRAPAILRETSEGTSYQMVRLVFRPYTQVGRPICTSGPLRASTRVSDRQASASYPEGNFGGNQLPDGSISLSPLYPGRTTDLHVRTATGLHQSFLWLRPAQA